MHADDAEIFSPSNIGPLPTESSKNIFRKFAYRMLVLNALTASKLIDSSIELGILCDQRLDFVSISNILHFS